MLSLYDSTTKVADLKKVCAKYDIKIYSNIRKRLLLSKVNDYVKIHNERIQQNERMQKKQQLRKNKSCTNNIYNLICKFYNTIKNLNIVEVFVLYTVIFNLYKLIKIIYNRIRGLPILK